MNIYPYKAGSKSAKELANALGVKRIKHKNSRFKGRVTKTVINWGASALPYEVSRCNVINLPEAVAAASNKLQCLRILTGAGVNIPEYTTNKLVAQQWAGNGVITVCRTLLTANSGRGIVLAETPDEVVDAPLYTKYVNKKQEYRVHVFNGEVLDQQRKARKREVPDDQVNWKIRNHDNGFIFAREGVDLPEHALDEAINAVYHLGLVFGAVDLIWNEAEDKYYVLEVNTAPGLTGTTLEKYAEAFKEY